MDDFLLKHVSIRSQHGIRFKKRRHKVAIGIGTFAQLSVDTIRFETRGRRKDKNCISHTSRTQYSKEMAGFQKPIICNRYAEDSDSLEGARLHAIMSRTGGQSVTSFGTDTIADAEMHAHINMLVTFIFVTQLPSAAILMHRRRACLQPREGVW